LFTFVTRLQSLPSGVVISQYPASITGLANITDDECPNLEEFISRAHGNSEEHMVLECSKLIKY